MVLASCRHGAQVCLSLLVLLVLVLMIFQMAHASENAQESKTIRGTAVTASAPPPTASDKAKHQLAEFAPTGPPKPPPAPPRPVAKPLPWPFDGDYKAQRIQENYQQVTDSYVHMGLDFMHPAGTPVKAIGSGWVAYIKSSPPHTHDDVIVTPVKGSNKGWAYVHMDLRTFAFKEGDFIEQGQVLGKLAEFAIDGRPKSAHLHLQYVTFSKGASGKLAHISGVIDPLYFFDWHDAAAPSILPLKFVYDKTLEQFKPDSSGAITVSGKVDILAAITDTAYPGQKEYFGVPVVMLSISDGNHTVQKLVLDHRGTVELMKVRPLYLARKDAMAAFKRKFPPYYQGMRVTKTDGDGKISAKDDNECWDTTARDANGEPLWPGGEYSVNVYAWDIAGNRGVASAKVRVDN